MKRRFLSVVLLGGLLFNHVMAADTLTIKQRRIGEYERESLLCRRVWRNVALRYDKLPFSLTEIQVDGFMEKRKEAAVAQEGNRRKEIAGVVSSSFVLDEHSRLFGNASYRSGRRENVMWNENSDFEYLYPYVVGDSIGGFMEEETYRFSGGYVYRFGKWTAGAELDYRAMTAYRDKDPRPRNIVSDLTVSAAASYLVGKKYRLGISGNLHTYNQKSSIAFLADKGSISVYQMLGLGMDYVRFAGSQTSTRYRGSGVGGSLDLLPVDVENGLSVSLRADYFHLTKELSDLNNIPVNENRITDIALEVAWNRRRDAWKYGVAGTALVQQRTGTENIFGDPTGNVYLQVSSVDLFRSSLFHIVLNGMVGQPVTWTRRWGWTVEPFFSYSQTRPEYKSTSRYVKLASAQGGAHLKSVRKLSEWFLTTCLSGSYVTNRKADISLPGFSSERSVARTLLSNIRYLGDDCASMELALRGDYFVATRYALYFSAAWRHQQYKECGTANRMEISIGCIF